jgi:hypothetical protein
MIIVISSSTSTPAIARLFEISFRTGLIQADRLLRGYTRCGRETILFYFYSANVLIFRICIPTTDAICGSLGEGIEEILGLKRGKRVQYSAYKLTNTTQCLSLSHSLSLTRPSQSKAEAEPTHVRVMNNRAVPCFVGNPGKCQLRLSQVIALFLVYWYPANDFDLVAVRPQYADLIDNLVVTTDRFITGARNASNPSARSSAHGEKPRSAPVPLLWSAALRVHQDIFIQASIEYVFFFSNFIAFMELLPRIGRSRKYSHLSDSGQF